MTTAELEHRLIMNSTQTKSSTLKTVLNSSIGRKGIVAFSGLFLIGFIIVHLLGNLLFYVSADAFNYYGYQLSKNKAIYTVLELGILAGFLLHIGLTAWNTWTNSRARPVKYSTRRTLGKSTLFSANMGITGTIVLVFVMMHVRGFRFGEKTSIPVPGVPGETMYDLYSLLLTHLSDPVYAWLYIIAVCLVGAHLSHGLQSAFKSIGIYSGKLESPLKWLAFSFGFIVAIGFASIPFAIWLGYR